MNETKHHVSSQKLINFKCLERSDHCSTSAQYDFARNRWNTCGYLIGSISAQGDSGTKLVPGDTFSPYSPHGNPWFGDNGHTNGGIEFCVLHESRNVSRHVNLCWQIILNSIEVETLVFIYLGNSMNFAITSQPYLVFRLGFDIKYFLNTYANTNQKVYNLKFESSFKQDKIENTYIRTH